MTEQMAGVREDEIRAWRLSIEACQGAGGVPLGHFNWPFVLGSALDYLDAARAEVDLLREQRDALEHMAAGMPHSDPPCGHGSCYCGGCVL